MLYICINYVSIKLGKKDYKVLVKRLMNKPVMCAPVLCVHIQKSISSLSVIILNYIFNI